MCCFTHDTIYPGTEPPDDRWRCRCGVGQGIDLGTIQNGYGPCQRKATQEDALCDICSGRDVTPMPMRVANAGLEESGFREYLKDQMTKYFENIPAPDFGSDQWAWNEGPAKLTFDVKPVPGEPGKFIAYGTDAEELIRRIRKIPPG